MTSAKTVEFLIDYKIPSQWLDTLTRVWNEGVFLLSWLEHQENLAKLLKQCDVEASESITENLENSKLRFAHPRLAIQWRKVEGRWEAYQPLEIRRRIDKTKSWDDANLETVSVFEIDRDRRPWVNPKWLEPCPLTGIKAIDLRKPFAQKRCEWLTESGVPQILVNDFIGMVLAPAWDAYKSNPEHGRPRRKKEDDRVSCICSESIRGHGKYLGGDRFQLPGLRELEVPGLARRLMLPLARMARAMRENPETFPAIAAKCQSYLEKERGKLLKADGLSVGALRKTLPSDEVEAILRKYEARVDRSGFVEEAIAYFERPGSFRLFEREGKTYLQLTAVAFPTIATPSTKEVGVDAGVNYLAVTTSGLVVKHQDWSKEESRLEKLDAAISRCVRGSNEWKKRMAKKRKIEGRISRSKAKRQAYFASQITDVNGTIAVRRIKPLEAVAIPLPKPSVDGDRYLPNGRTKARERNRKTIDCATGQFVILLEQQSIRRGRVFSRVDVEDTASAVEILEVSQNLPPVGARSEYSPSSRESGEMVGICPTSDGKGNRLSRSPKKHASKVAPLAGAPKPVKGSRRSRKKEREIG